MCEWLLGVSVGWGPKLGEADEPVASFEDFERAGGAFDVGVEPAVEGESGGEVCKGAGEVGFEMRC